MKDTNIQTEISAIVDAEVQAINTLIEKGIKHMLSCCSLNTEGVEGNTEKSEKLKKEIQRRKITTGMTRADFIIGPKTPLFYLNVFENNKIIMSATIIRTVTDEKTTISLSYSNHPIDYYKSLVDENLLQSGQVFIRDGEQWQYQGKQVINYMVMYQIKWMDDDLTEVYEYEQFIGILSNSQMYEE